MQRRCVSDSFFKKRALDHSAVYGNFFFRKCKINTGISVAHKTFTEKLYQPGEVNWVGSIPTIRKVVVVSPVPVARQHQRILYKLHPNPVQPIG